MTKVFFRVDSSLAIGSGHISRCFYLSEILEDMGFDSVFIINKRNFFKFPNINPKNYTFISSDSIEEDASQTSSIIDSDSVLVIDSYKHDIEWGSKLSKRHKLIVWDDLANRTHKCDMLIDCGFLRTPANYEKLVPSSTKLLIGLNYCPISKSFMNFKFSHKEADRIHLFFGSSDDGSILLKYFEYLLKYYPYLKFNLAFSRPLSENLHFKLSKLIRSEDRIYIGRPMAESLNTSSLAFGAPGITTWERLYLGIYSYYLANHPNQIPILIELEKKGLCKFLGEINDLHGISLLPQKLPENVPSESCFKELVDGEGLSRIAKEIIAL